MKLHLAGLAVFFTLCSAVVSVPFDARAQEESAAQRQNESPPSKTCKVGELLLDSPEDLRALADRHCTKLVGWVTVRSKAAQTTALRAFSGIRVIGGDLTIRGVPTLETLEGLNDLQEITGHLRIIGNDQLQNLAGLDLTRTDGSVTLAHLPALEDIGSLSSLRYVGGHLRLVGLPNVESLKPLGSIVNIGRRLQIAYLPRISSLSGLGEVATVGRLEIEGNQRLTSLAGLSNLSQVKHEGLRIVDNPALDQLGLPARLEDVRGEITVKNNGRLEPCAVDSLLTQIQREDSEENVSIEDLEGTCH